MTQEETDRATQAGDAQPYSTDTMIEHLAHELGEKASAAAVYGAPVQRDGITVIPVAKVRYGFGGGIGRKEEEQGSGGGGGIQISPLGYIEINRQGSRFRPIRDRRTWVAAALVTGGLFFGLLGRWLRKT